MAHRHVERDTCPQAGFLEDHAQHLAFEQRRIALLEIFSFELDRDVKQILSLCRGKIGYCQKMFHAYSFVDKV